MDEIILVDYSSPWEGTTRRFRLNLTTKKVSFEDGVAALFNFSAGWGAKIKSLRTNAESFVALFINDRNLVLWINDSPITVTPSMYVGVKRHFPAAKTFKLLEEQVIREELDYWWFPWDDDDLDVLTYCASVIGNPVETKMFAYRFAARRAGRERKMPERGFTDALAAKIQDPFDLSFDVDDT